MSASAAIVGLIISGITAAVKGGTAAGAKARGRRQQEEIEREQGALKKDIVEFSQRERARGLEKSREEIEQRQKMAFEDIEQGERDIKSSSIRDIIGGKSQGKISELRKKQENFLRRGGDLG